MTGKKGLILAIHATIHLLLVLEEPHCTLRLGWMMMT